MRTVLVTGPGGAGRTTVAAATALAAAREGARVLLLGTDREDTLGRLLGTPAGSAPAAPGAADVGPGGGAQQVEGAAGGAPDGSAGGASEVSPKGAPDVAPGGGPDVAPGGGPDVAPGGAPDVAPGGASVVPPGGASGTPVAFAVPAFPAVRAVAANLSVARVDAAADFRAELAALQERAATALDLLRATALDDDELTELPGAEPFALLRALRTVPARYDLVVVDMPPTHATLDALALPEQLRRYLRRLLPPERQAARSLRPMLAQLAGVPMPAEWLYATAARWQSELAATQAVVESPALSVRLVVEPGPAAADALRTARLGLALHGLALDAVVANRVLPTASPDPWLVALGAQQQEHLKEVREGPQPVCELPHLGRAPRGVQDLALLSYETGRGPGDGVSRPTVEDRIAEDGVLVWHLPLPGAVKSELGLVRRGDELVLTVGRFRRTLPLPSALRRCTVSGAALADGVLRVRFTPDPGLWPRGR
ncbi:ArsA-related P-loop ATPase [Streptomyces sp. NPDC091272]|uniref:ArsA family ATPase n=1 Tax=Streptomyces sp. NPDC091272 TaxID=3365981 RepID=UPI00381024B4